MGPPLRVVLLISVLFALGTADAAPPTYDGRRVAKPMSPLGAPWLVRPERAEEENTAALLEVLALKPGQTACDIGVGNGYHAVPMARAVGDGGRVYGVDIEPEMLSLLQQRATAAAVQIEGVLGSPMDPGLPPNTCDLVLMVDAYHEFSDPATMMSALHAALTPAGRMVVVEFREEDPRVPILPAHKMLKEQVVAEIAKEELGLRLIEQHDHLPWQHVLVFGRMDGPHPPVDPIPWTDP